MDDEKKKIFLYMFVVGIIDLVFFTISGQFWYMILIAISMVIGYFAVYPDEFFLCINNAKNYIQNYLRNYKTNSAIKSNNNTENTGTSYERFEEERNIKKVNENSNKRINLPFDS